MRSIRLWDENCGPLLTRFIVAGSAYQGEFFIFVDDNVTDPMESQTSIMLEEIKLKIRDSRADAERRKVQRYTADEVASFLNEAQKIT